MGLGLNLTCLANLTDRGDLQVIARLSFQSTLKKALSNVGASKIKKRIKVWINPGGQSGDLAISVQ
jgi:hypothetical protein